MYNTSYHVCDDGQSPPLVLAGNEIIRSTELWKINNKNPNNFRHCDTSIHDLSRMSVCLVSVKEKKKMKKKKKCDTRRWLYARGKPTATCDCVTNLFDKGKVLRIRKNIVEDIFTILCGEFFSVVSMGCRAEGQAWADPGARTPIGASGIIKYLLFYPLLHIPC